MPFNLKVIREVKEHLNRRRDGYLELLGRVKAASEAIAKQYGSEYVHSVYSRAKKPGDDEIKSTLKIARKLAKRRTDDPRCNIESINDIIGVTVVVTYSDYIELISNAIREELGKRHIITTSPEPKSKDGYYAHHIDCMSNTGTSAKLYCELQIKTMLHNVWGAKTHDMTYKPRGRHDSELTEMTQIIGDSIEVIEKQSTRLRQMIQQQWEAEGFVRQEAQRRLFDSLVPREHKSDWPGPEYRKIRDEIEKGQQVIVAMHADDPRLGDLQSRISSLLDEDSTAWLLAIRLAFARNDGNIEFPKSLIERYRLEAHAELAKSDTHDTMKSAENKIIFAIMALYTLGSHDDTVMAAYEALEEKNISNRARAEISFNLATFLLEHECHVSGDEKHRERATAEVDRLLLSTAELTEGDPAMDDGEIIETTYALKDIAFNQDLTAVEKAIKVCESAPSKASPAEKMTALKYSAYYTRLGWRRLLRLEGIQAMSAASKVRPSAEKSGGAS